MIDTATASKTTLPVSKPQQEKSEAKIVAPVLRISKLAKDGSIDIESNGGTTTIKLDKFRIEVPSAVKINIK